MGEPKTGDGKRNRTNAEMFTDNLDHEQSLIRNRQRFDRDDSDMDAEDDTGHDRADRSCSHGDSSEMVTQTEQATQRLEKMKIGEGQPGDSSGATGVMDFTEAEVPQCFVQSEVSVPISPLELHLCSVELPTRRAGELCPSTVTRVVLTQPEAQRTHCYDLDIGTMLLCSELRLEGKKLHRLGAGSPQVRLVVFRKSYLRRHVPVYDGLTDAYPDTVLVSGVKYRIHHAESESRNCFGIATDERVEVKLYPACPVHAPAAGNSAAGAVPVATPPVLVLYQPAAQSPDGVQRILRGLELPQGFDHLRAGNTLWPPLYGEVYKGFRLPAQSASDASNSSSGSSVSSNSAAEFSFLRSFEEVAVKAVRHHNDHFPGGEVHWHTLKDEGFTAPMHPIHHQVPGGPGSALTSKDLAPHFEQERARGRNENVMNEVETMEFIEQGVKKAVEAFRATAAPGTRCPLEGRFIGHRDVALSCDNLFIITKYTPFGSVDTYVRRGLNRVLTPLSEACTKRVVLHMLQALDFLHQRGLAHQDLSLENLLVQTLVSHPGLLSSYRTRETTGSLSDEHFSLLELVLIDMGHVGAHERLAPSDGLNLSGMTVDTAATATTCESVSGCNESPKAAPMRGTVGAGAAVHSRANSVDSSNSEAVPPPAVPPEPRRFKRRTVPQHPLGKVLYRSPQISSTLNAYPRRGAAPPPPREYCGFCLDMWQLGVLAVCLLTGNTPYDLNGTDSAAQEESEKAWFAAVRGGRLAEYMEERARQAPSATASGAVATAAAGPSVRTASASVSGVAPGAPSPAAPARPLCSPLALDLLQRLLAYNEADRITARRALHHPWFQ